MTFREEETTSFEQMFEQYRSAIRSQQGCHHLELWRDQNDPRIFFTYSHWESESHLNAYRHSDLFAEVWPQTKALFDAKPEAWSVGQVH